MAREIWPELPFAVWRKLRGSFGQCAKRERLRLHALPNHAEYVPRDSSPVCTGVASCASGISAGLDVFFFVCARFSARPARTAASTTALMCPASAV